MTADTAQRFAADTTDHVFHLLRDDGLYRHLRCQRPDSGMYWWEVLTWPDVLVIHGDMGTFVFTRLTDMFEFFRGQRINPLYWSEKVIAGQDQILAYSEGLFRQRVEEYVSYYAEELTDVEAQALRAAVQAEVLDSGDAYYHEGAQMLLSHFSHVVGEGREFQFHDTWEWELKEYTHRFLWCLHAILWTIEEYDKAKEKVDA